MIQGVTLLIDYFRIAWTAITGAVMVIGLLVLLFQTLRALSATVIGSRMGLSHAVGTSSGLFFILLFATLAVPSLSKTIAQTMLVESSDLCQPLADLGILFARLIAALAALRMLLVMVQGAVMAGMGSRSAFTSLTEAGETVVGMLFALLAAPTAAHFLGLC